MGLTVGTGMAISAGTSLVGSIFGTKKADHANKRALQAEQRANAEALALERENERRRREEFDRIEAENRRRWNIEADRDERRWAVDQGRLTRREAQDVDIWNAEQRRRQPYRDVSWAAVQDLANRAGLQVRLTTPPRVAPPPPPPQAMTMAQLLEDPVASAQRKVL